MLTTFRAALLAVALLSVPVVGLAQAPTPSADPLSSELLPPSKVPGKYSTYLYQRYAQDREARAVTHLFKRKKRGGLIWLGTGAVSIGWLSTQTGTRESGGGTRTVSVSPLGWGVLVGFFGGIGVGKLARFDNTRLYHIMKEHDQNFPFPNYVRKRLRDRDYENTGSVPATVQ